ncbi:hypothetical protein GQE99_06570 [Maritimibacter sp. DP07]|uniref:Uncharacterized protein n=1 Tax=Maritimibacter harenae TaxID=2606218 RepID=A0A845M5E1_9RHOB|nr:hypothetical protein [Maritimibacter harenae]MZR12683.1 hypothetical protein [Maritimibacter harenae]
MKTKFTIAANIRCYFTIDVEAETPEAATEKLTYDRVRDEIANTCADDMDFDEPSQVGILDRFTEPGEGTPIEKYLNDPWLNIQYLSSEDAEALIGLIRGHEIDSGAAGRLTRIADALQEHMEYLDRDGATHG